MLVLRQDVSCPQYNLTMSCKNMFILQAYTMPTSWSHVHKDQNSKSIIFVTFSVLHNDIVKSFGFFYKYLLVYNFQLRVFLLKFQRSLRLMYIHKNCFVGIFSLVCNGKCTFVYKCKWTKKC